MAKSKKKSKQKPASQPENGLELPEDYNPKKSKMLRRGGRRPTKMDKKIMAADRALPSMPIQDISPVAEARLKERADEFGIDLNAREQPSKLVFKKDRAWRSIKDPETFFDWYSTFQKRKSDPQVFVIEEPADHPEKGADYVAWFQQCRYAYYQSQGRLDHLRLLETTKHWPYVFGSTTKAPFLRASIEENPRSHNMTNRQLPIFKACAIGEIAKMILTHLPHFRDMANLSQTCNTAFDLVSEHIEQWNLTPPGDYLGDNEKDRSKELNDGLDLSPVALVVTPIRQNMSKCDKERRYASYESEFQSTYQLFRALLSRMNTITSLQLHRTQFLDVTGIKCIIASMPRLKNIGIYQCPLVHLDQTGAILDIIKKNPKSHGYVQLDIFPMFHKGPNSLTRHGSFGVTWNPTGMDLNTGVLQLAVWELYPKAKALGMDLFEMGSSFRHFLELCPLPPWAVVRAYEAIKTLEHAGYDLEAYNTSDAHCQRFADELASALFGDCAEPSVVSGKRLGEILGTDWLPNQIRKFGWWRVPRACIACEVPVPAMFFPFAEHRCWGCILKHELKRQIDHFNYLKAALAKEWYGDCNNLAQCVVPWETETTEPVPDNKELAAAEPGPSNEEAPTTEPVPGNESPMTEPGQGQTETESTSAESDTDNTKLVPISTPGERYSKAEKIAKDMDKWRHYEATHAHGIDEVDSIRHPLFNTTERRHARAYEPHGPIDRRLADRQYYPVGHFGARASQTVASKYAAAFQAHNDYYMDWLTKRVIEHPDETDQKRSKAWKGLVARKTAMYIKQKNYEDMIAISLYATMTKQRTTAPNRPAWFGCWDRRIDEMLKELHLRDRRGQLIQPPSFMVPDSFWSTQR